MTLQWQYTAADGWGVLSLAGRLEGADASRVAGAVGWVVARGSGPLIVDLLGLESWSVEGQAVIVAAARRLAEHGRTLELAAIPASGTAAVIYNAAVPIAVHVDLAAAMASHPGASGTQESWRRWSSAGWADPGTSGAG
jgi:hypothetical protein